MKVRSRGGLVLAALGAALCVLACGGTTEETGFPGNVDCNACGENEVCWWSEDYDNTAFGGCREAPEDCPTPTTCECLENTNDHFCEVPQGCQTVEDLPVVYCVTTLG